MILHEILLHVISFTPIYEKLGFIYSNSGWSQTTTIRFSYTINFPTVCVSVNEKGRHPNVTAKSKSMIGQSLTWFNNLACVQWPQVLYVEFENSL